MAAGAEGAERVDSLEARMGQEGRGGVKVARAASGVGGEVRAVVAGS